MVEYHGIIVKQGLRGPSILSKMETLGKKKAGKWVLLRVSVSESRIKEVIGLVQKCLVKEPAYYAHFYQEELIVVFPEKIFQLTPDKRTEACNRLR
jgi:hypothetical protein